MRLELIAELPIATDTETTARAWREIRVLARAEGLTTYDATYLELAMERFAAGAFDLGLARLWFDRAGDAGRDLIL